MNAGTVSVRYPLPWPLRLLVSVALGAILPPTLLFGMIIFAVWTLMRRRAAD